MRSRDGGALRESTDRVYDLDPKGKTYVSQALFDKPPKNVAVLPAHSLVGGGRVEGSRFLFRLFDGEKAENPQSREESMRRAFFGQFAKLEFDHMKISRVERTLKEEELDSWEKIRAVSPQLFLFFPLLLALPSSLFGFFFMESFLFQLLLTILFLGIRFALIFLHDNHILSFASFLISASSKYFNCALIYTLLRAGSRKKSMQIKTPESSRGKCLREGNAFLTSPFFAIIPLEIASQIRSAERQ